MLSKPIMRMLFTTLPATFLYLLICLYLCCGFTQRVAAKNTIRCIQWERQALLDFKQGLFDEFGILSSWGNDSHQTECCNWWGVQCNNNTGHVTMLDLHHTPFDDYGNQINMRGSKVSPSLLELNHLKYLDLSYIDFQGNHFPDFIASFGGRLRVLSLMETNFAGTIPPQLGNLTNLRDLNITSQYKLKTETLEWLPLLYSLRCIHFDGVDLSGLPRTIVSLPPFLEVLQLSDCGLQGTLPNFSLNSSSPSLSVVDFSLNSLTSSSSVGHFLHNATKQLTTIDLSQNNFAGPIPYTFGDMPLLESLYLDANSFIDGIPKSFGNLTHLQGLSLSGNQLNESVGELFEKLSSGGAAGKSLQTLYLSENKLNGELLADISTRFPSLRELYASENQLNGSCFALPSSLGNLYLSDNKIRGSFQDMMKCFGEESDLVCLDLSNNQITGQFADVSHFPSLKSYISLEINYKGAYQRP